MGKIIYNLRENRQGDVVSKENRAYDKFGRLAETAAGFGSKVTYAYDSKGDFFHALLELEAQWKLYGGTIQAVQSNADAIWAKVINDDMEGFVTAANSPTISWFENSPDWIRLSHKGHDWKWIKE